MTLDHDNQPQTLKENNQRLRFLSEAEISALLFQCQFYYLREIVECALHTGMRKAEMLDLKWSQIRNGHIYLIKTKSKKTDRCRLKTIWLLYLSGFDKDNT